LKEKTKIILEMVLVFAITVLLIYLLHGNDTLLSFIKIISLTMLLYLSSQLRETGRKG
jgi:threonine/homoserine/homoserine lactone efflux protein